MERTAAKLHKHRRDSAACRSSPYTAVRRDQGKAVEPCRMSMKNLTGALSWRCPWYCAPWPSRFVTTPIPAKIAIECDGCLAAPRCDFLPKSRRRQPGGRGGVWFAMMYAHRGRNRTLATRSQSLLRMTRRCRPARVRMSVAPRVKLAALPESGVAGPDHRRATAAARGAVTSRSWVARARVVGFQVMLARVAAHRPAPAPCAPRSNRPGHPRVMPGPSPPGTPGPNLGRARRMTGAQVSAPAPQPPTAQMGPRAARTR